MRTKYLIILIISLSFFSCKKYLDAKPDAALVIPSTVEDLQRLLDNNAVMNVANGTIAESAADNYYINYPDYSSLSEAARNCYSWGPELFFDLFQNDWSSNYTVIYNANTVLENLEKIDRTAANVAAWDNAKGSALIFRGLSFYRLVTTYSLAFNPASANAGLGIPLRLNTDFNEPSVRASVQQCYDQVITDLHAAVSLLPVVPDHKMRPSKPAAYAMLAKLYLAVGDFNKSFLYADSCLRLFNTLINYNTVNSAASFPFPLFNNEVIWSTVSNTIGTMNPVRCKIDSFLYSSYAADDLRKLVFFKDNGNGTFAFKGHYTGSNSVFNGIAADEVYLIRAECAARMNNISASMDDLNTLLSTRWKTGTFVPFSASSSQQALNLVLTERRKELLFRDIRFADIKRLNRQGENISIVRNLNGNIIQLTPNDNRFALPIPYKVIDISGMPQNPR